MRKLYIPGRKFDFYVERALNAIYLCAIFSLTLMENVIYLIEWPPLVMENFSLYKKHNILVIIPTVKIGQKSLTAEQTRRWHLYRFFRLKFDSITESYINKLFLVYLSFLELTIDLFREIFFGILWEIWKMSEYLMCLKCLLMVFIG